MITDYEGIADCAWNAPWTASKGWRSSPIQRDRDVNAVYASRSGLDAWAWNPTKGAWLCFNWIVDRYIFNGVSDFVGCDAKEVYRA